MAYPTPFAPAAHAPAGPSNTDTASCVSPADGHSPVLNIAVGDFDGALHAQPLSLTYCILYSKPLENAIP